MDNGDKKVDPELESFQKRAVELMANKFISDYRMVMSNNSKGEELEHFYEVWAYNHIREIALREQVWRCVMHKMRKR